MDLNEVHQRLLTIHRKPIRYLPGGKQSEM